MLATPQASDELSEADVCPVSPRTIVEAMLFVGRPNNLPLSPRELAAVIRGVSPREVESIVSELNDQYDRDAAAFHIASEGGGFRMALRDDLHRVRDRFYGKVRAARLSQAAVDVLSIVAYNQPVGIDKVNELRGKPSGAIMAQLVRRRLVRLERPPESPRKPHYWTTERFLKLFHLDDLKDLPRAEDLETH